MATTYWYQGRALSPAEHEALQAEKAARRPADAVDRCLVIAGGGAFCMMRARGSGLFGLLWRGAKVCRDDERYVAVRGTWWSDHAGTRGWIKLRVSFSPDDQRGEVACFHRYAGLLPSEPLPAWVGDPLGNLRRFGQDVAKWEA